MPKCFKINIIKNSILSIFVYNFRRVIHCFYIFKTCYIFTTSFIVCPINDVLEVYMIESWLFVFAVIAVLLVPGPTNALLASSAHHQGFSKTLILVPIELLGYVYAISIWALVIHLSMPIWPNLIHILHVVSTCYVLWLAFKLWKTSYLQQHSKKNTNFSKARLFKETLKNPKSLLFSAGIFPIWTWDSFLNYAFVVAVFTLCLIPCALLWIYLGRRLLSGSVKVMTADRLYKGSAMLLMLCMLPVFAGFFNF